MPHLLDLTTQGDVGTMADESRLATVALMDPQALYELWERQPWSEYGTKRSATARPAIVTVQPYR